MLKHLSKFLVVFPFLPFIIIIFLNTVSLISVGEIALSYPRTPSKPLLLAAKLRPLEEMPRGLALSLPEIVQK